MSVKSDTPTKQTRVTPILIDLLILFWIFLEAPDLVITGFFVFSPILFGLLVLFLCNPLKTYERMVELRLRFIGISLAITWLLLTLFTDLPVTADTLFSAPAEPTFSGMMVFVSFLYFLLFSLSGFFLGLAAFFNILLLRHQKEDLDYKYKVSVTKAVLLSLLLLPIIGFGLFLFLGIFVLPALDLIG